MIEITKSSKSVIHSHLKCQRVSESMRKLGIFMENLCPRRIFLKKWIKLAAYNFLKSSAQNGDGVESCHAHAPGGNIRKEKKWNALWPLIKENMPKDQMSVPCSRHLSRGLRFPYSCCCSFPFAHSP